MKNISAVLIVGSVAAIFALSSCAMQDDMPAKPAAPAPVAKAPAPAKAETKEAKAAPAEKAKATKLAGDVGLLDTEKNYMILVTKEGKLVTIDFDSKAKATQINSHPSKMSEIGLGSSATVVYEKAGEKNIAKSVEFKAAKGE